MLQDVHTRKEGTVDAAFGLINSLTRSKRALSISPIQGTLQSLFTGSKKLSLRKQKCQINKSSVLGKESSKGTPFEVKRLRSKNASCPVKYRKWSIKRHYVYSNKCRSANLGIYKLTRLLCYSAWYKEISKPYHLRNKTSTNSWVLKF